MSENPETVPELLHADLGDGLAAVQILRSERDAARRTATMLASGLMALRGEVANLREPDCGYIDHDATDNGWCWGCDARRDTLDAVLALLDEIDRKAIEAEDPGERFCGWCGGPPLPLPAAADSYGGKCLSVAAARSKLLTPYRKTKGKGPKVRRQVTRSIQRGRGTDVGYQARPERDDHGRR